MLERIYSNPVTRPCDYCGGDFVANVPRNKYCCQQCAQRGWREKNAEHVREWQKRWWRGGIEPLVARQCKFCSEAFIPKTATQIYCSRTCQCQRVKRNYNARPCDTCGTMFKPRQGDQLRCSKRCHNKYWRRKIATRQTKKIEPRTCDYCGGKYTPHQGNRTQVYCQSSCSKRGWREKNSERAKAADRRRYYADPERAKLRNKLKWQRYAAKRREAECTHTAKPGTCSSSSFASPEHG